ncbi:unnamed protein product [Bathycoccus prasinos]|jgi:hypothetical protein|tara:strand:- start:44 stop:2560 length:2517 start_codon:yes stop_codon:yes gene_type:complete
MTTDENDGALMSAAPPNVAALLTFTNVHTTTNANTTNKFSKSGEEEDLVDDEIERVLNSRGVKRSSFFEIEKNGAENIEDVTFGAMMKTHVDAMISHALLVSEDATIVISGDDVEMTLKQFACAISWASESLFEKELRRVPKSAFTLKATCAAIGMKEKATLVDVVAMRMVGGLGASSSEDERKGAKLERAELVNKEDARDIVKYLPRGDDRAVGFCFYLKVGENRPVGKLRLIALPPVAPKASVFATSTSEEVLKRQASVSRISAVASALREYGGMDAKSQQQQQQQSDVLARRWRKNPATRLLHAMLVDDADEGESSGDSNSGNYVFQKYFRSACIINGSTPYGGTQIANMAATTAILPPPPPSVKKIVHMQQQNHEKQRSKKILELETRAKVAVNVPLPPPPMMTAQKVERERLENKLGGRNNSVRIATTSTPNASPLPFQFTEDNEDDMPPTPQNLNFHTPQMAFHSDEQRQQQQQQQQNTQRKKRTPLADISVTIPSPPVVNASNDNDYYAAIIGELKLNLEQERKRTVEAEERAMKSSEAESIWLSRMSAARHEDEKRRDELEMLRQLHAEMQARAKDAEEKANVIEERCKDYRKLSAELEAECSRLRTSAQNAESLANGFEQELQGKTKALEAEAAELNRVIEKFTSTEEECTKARALSRLLQTQLDQTNRKFDDVSAKLEDSEKREDVLKRKLKTVEDDRDSFRAKAEDAETALQPTKLLAQKQLDEIKSREADRDVAYAAADFARRTNASVSAQRDKLLAENALLREKLAVTEAAAKSALSGIDFANGASMGFGSTEDKSQQPMNSAQLNYESPSWLHEYAAFSRVGTA